MELGRLERPGAPMRVSNDRVLSQSLKNLRRSAVRRLRVRGIDPQSVLRRLSNSGGSWSNGQVAAIHRQRHPDPTIEV